MIKDCIIVQLSYNNIHLVCSDSLFSDRTLGHVVYTGPENTGSSYLDTRSLE